MERDRIERPLIQTGLHDNTDVQAKHVMLSMVSYSCSMPKRAYDVDD
jgi:hypothetical protein